MVVVKLLDPYHTTLDNWISNGNTDNGMVHESKGIGWSLKSFVFYTPGKKYCNTKFETIFFVR
jgi:hypothetical protein